jgi:hypothetical protein
MMHSSPKIGVDHGENECREDLEEVINETSLFGTLADDGGEPASLLAALGAGVRRVTGSLVAIAIAIVKELGTCPVFLFLSLCSSTQNLLSCTRFVKMGLFRRDIQQQAFKSCVEPTANYLFEISLRFHSFLIFDI